MMKLFLYLTLIALFVAALPHRPSPPPIEKDEVDAQMEAIRSGKSVWSDFTAWEVGSIAIGIIFLLLALWFIDFAFGNRDVIWVFIHRIFNF